MPHGTNTPATALTTVWTSPASCTNSPFDYPSTGGPCAPPEWEKYWDTSAHFYYSPAICPNGYSVGCSRYASVQGPPVESTETAMLCVPTGLTCNTAYTYYADSPSSFLPYLQIRWADSDIPFLETHPLTPGLKGAQATGGGGGGGGGGTSTDTTGGSTGRTGGSTGTPTGPRSGDGTAPPNSGGSSGLSAGAIAGISIGAAIVVFVPIVVAVILLMKRRGKQSPPLQQPTSQQPTPGQGPPPGLAPQQMPPPQMMQQAYYPQPGVPPQGFYAMPPGQAPAGYMQTPPPQGQWVQYAPPPTASPGPGMPQGTPPVYALPPGGLAQKDAMSEVRELPDAMANAQPNPAVEMQGTPVVPGTSPATTSPAVGTEAEMEMLRLRQAQLEAENARLQQRMSQMQP